MKVIIKIEDKELRQRIKKLLNKAENLCSIADDEARYYFEFEARRLVSNNLLKIRSGKLRDHIEGGAKPMGGKLWAYVGVAKLKYAPVQEFGAEIRPRRARFLAIPQKPVLTAAGVHRYPSARYYPGKLHFDKERMALRDEKGRIAYILRRKVRIKEKAFLRKAVQNKLSAFLHSLIEEITKR